MLRRPMSLPTRLGTIVEEAATWLGAEETQETDGRSNVPIPTLQGQYDVMEEGVGMVC